MARFLLVMALVVAWVGITAGAGCAPTRTPYVRTCAGCGKPVPGKCIDAGGTFFHAEHFRCTYCDSLITDDTYIPYGDAHYHESCYLGQIVVCAYCGDPGRKDTFVTHEGKTYHSSCAREHILTCAYCGKVTEEDAFVHNDGKSYHRSCYRENVVACAFCGIPIGKGTYTLSEGKKYHDDCFAKFVVPTCTLCGSTIDGDFTTDYWGGRYHVAHMADAPECDFCGRLLKTPLGQEVARYDDGRILCGVCRTSAVVTLREVKVLAGEVAERLGRLRIDVDAGALAYHLVDAEEMRRLNRHGRHRITGLTKHAEVPGVPGRTTYDQIDVYLLRGMPKAQMMAAIAHELTHVWQLVNCPLLVNFTLSEASCQYASYRVLETVPGAESEYLIHTMDEDDDRVYGRAMRRVKRYAEENGVSRWLILLKTNESLPGGR